MKPIVFAIVVGSAAAAPAVKRQGFIPPNWGFPPGWGDPSLQPSPTCEFWPLGVSPTATPTVDGDGTAQAAAAAALPAVRVSLAPRAVDLRVAGSGGVRLRPRAQTLTRQLRCPRLRPLLRPPSGSLEEALVDVLAWKQFLVIGVWEAIDDWR
ncbi:hypothetical protein PG990_000135 [Apiospora arundinis]